MEATETNSSEHKKKRGSMVRNCALTGLEREFEIDGLEQTGPRQLQKVLLRSPSTVSPARINRLQTLFFFLLKKQTLRRENPTD